MSIRMKLMLSYAAMLFIPFVITMFIALLLSIVFRGDLQTISKHHMMGRGMLENRQVERMLTESEHTMLVQPDKLHESRYLGELDQKLREYGAQLVVRVNQRVVYPASLTSIMSADKLPVFKLSRQLEAKGPVKQDDQYISYMALNFMQGQDQVSIIAISKVSSLVNFARNYFQIIFIACIIILILTNTLLTYIVSRSLIRPIQKLKNAMKRIEAGDLAFEVQSTSKDEIGQLVIAFEQMRQQLHHSLQTQQLYEENRKELISNISHDLRTPLTAIRGYVDGLGDGVADTPEKRQRYIEIISAKAEQMDHLIDELFLYSKLDLKQMPFQFEQVDIHMFLMDWCDDLQFELSKRGVAFTSAVQLEGTTDVLLDRDKMKRVFVNIVDNSLKYMDKAEKKIAVSAYLAEQHAVVEFRDNGQGMAENELPLIFDRFYRTDPSRNSNTGGSGLGLAITKQIIDGHQGTIEAMSRKGEYTCIRISLPLCQTDHGESI